jgi:predicted enzyme related to lactoylglutathione lyase
MTVQSMDLAWIVVDDLKAAVKFYTEVVGLQLMQSNEEFGWAELQGKNGARLGIGKCHEMNPILAGQNAIVTFTVEDLDQTKAEMIRKGAVCIGDVQEVPGHVRMQLVKDLDGNQFQMVQKYHTN